MHRRNGPPGERRIGRLTAQVGMDTLLTRYRHRPPRCDQSVEQQVDKLRKQARLALLLAMALVAFLSLSQEGGAQLGREGPPLSSVALLSRFALEQGLAAPSFAAELSG